MGDFTKKPLQEILEENNKAAAESSTFTVAGVKKRFISDVNFMFLRKKFYFLPSLTCALDNFPESSFIKVWIFAFSFLCFKLELQVIIEEGEKFKI